MKKSVKLWVYLTLVLFVATPTITNAQAKESKSVSVEIQLDTSSSEHGTAYRLCINKVDTLYQQANAFYLNVKKGDTLKLVAITMPDITTEYEWSMNKTKGRYDVESKVVGTKKEITVIVKKFYDCCEMTLYQKINGKYSSVCIEFEKE